MLTELVKDCVLAVGSEYYAARAGNNCRRGSGARRERVGLGADQSWPIMSLVPHGAAPGPEREPSGDHDE